MVRGSEAAADMRRLRKSWNTASAAQANQRSFQPEPIKIVVSASFTATPLTPYLGGMLVEELTKPVAVKHADYNQIVQTCLDPMAPFGHVPDVLVILWRAEDLWKRDLVDWALTADASAKASVLRGVTTLAQAIASAADAGVGQVIVALPPAIQIAEARVGSIGNPPALTLLMYEILNRIIEVAGNNPRIRYVDLNATLSSPRRNRH